LTSLKKYKNSTNSQLISLSRILIRINQKVNFINERNKLQESEQRRAREKFGIEKV